MIDFRYSVAIAARLRVCRPLQLKRQNRLRQMILLLVLVTVVVGLAPAIANDEVGPPTNEPVEQPVVEQPVVEQPVAEPSAVEAVQPMPELDGPSFKISRFDFEYGSKPKHPLLPDIEELDNLEVTLGKTDLGYIAPRPGAALVMLRLGDVPADTLGVFYASAILRVNVSVVEHFNKKYSLVGVYIAPNPEDIDERHAVERVEVQGRMQEVEKVEFEDLRGERTTLREQIWVGVVTKVRTIASGQRVPTKERINNKVHRNILDRSPVKPVGTFRADLAPAEALESGSIMQEVRQDSETGKEFLVTMGTFIDTGEQTDQGYEYPSSVWSEEEAMLHAAKNGAMFEEGGPVEHKDLLWKDMLDEYVMRLSRHPGRRVDVAVAAAGKRRGEVELDFLVAENKPWLAYFQVSNTGTKGTGKWKERFGLAHNQLTGNDDILNIDYATTGFDKSQALYASYEAPLLNLDKVRWGVHGSWYDFVSSEFAGAGLEDYKGQGWSPGADLTMNVFQDKDLFVDLVAGAEVRCIKVLNTGGQREHAAFIAPHVGLRAERFRDTSSSGMTVDYEWSNCLWGNSTDEFEDGDLAALGRTAPDADWMVLKFDAFHSFFLEPVLNPQAWKDPQSRWATLAHELALSLNGQYAFDYRLIPHAQKLVGGLYTVRGYPESVAAGDTVFVTNAEYRFHLPKAFNPNAAKAAKTDRGTMKLFGQRFDYLPSHPYGSADWDLIFKTFFDLGVTINNNSSLGVDEDDETLAATGLGLELKIRENISLRFDWGVALLSADNGEIDPGSQRLHFVATFLY